MENSSNYNNNYELHSINVNVNDDTQIPSKIKKRNSGITYQSSRAYKRSNYTPTITSEYRRNNVLQTEISDIEEYDEDEENDKIARIKRNRTRMQSRKMENQKIEEETASDIEYFDWFADDYNNNNDPDKDNENSEDEENEKKKKAEKKTTKYTSMFSKYSKIPKTIRNWSWLLCGDLIFLIPIIFELVFGCIKNKSSTKTWKTDCKYSISIIGYPLALWALWLIPTWSTYWVLKIVINIVPELLIRIVDLILGVVPKKIQNQIDYVRFLDVYIVNTLSALLAYLYLNAFFDVSEGKVAINNVSSLLLSCFVAFAIWAIEKTFLQHFAVSFHKLVFEDRVKEVNRANRILEFLNESRYKNKSSQNLYSDSEREINEKGKEEGSNIKIKSFVGRFAKFAKSVMKGSVESNSVLLRTSWDAKLLARNLYYHLGGTDKKEDELTFENFREFFNNDEECQEAFDLFDKDGNGNLSKAEIKGFIMDCYYEQKSIRKSIRDSDVALRKLDYLLKIIAVIVIVLLTLMIFNCNLNGIYVALSSIWVGVMFAISGTITSLVQSLIFLFITHPFDVGDRIEIDGQAYIVKDFGLTSVTMKKPNGEEIYAPTSELTTKFINNIRRSAPLIQVFNISVSSKNTTSEQIQNLQERLQAFIEKEYKHFSGRVIVSATEILDELRMNLVIAVQHKNNGQDAVRVRVRNDLFVCEIKNSIMELGLELPNPGLLLINIENQNGKMVPYEMDDRRMY